MPNFAHTKYYSFKREHRQSFREIKQMKRNNLNEVEILLVEDNPNDVELTLRALRMNNITNTIYVVRDGEEALDYVFARGQYSERHVENGPRVILLDVKLPKISGIEVLRQIKSDPRTKTISVVILTSSKEERDLVESYHLGVNSYISKPVDFDKFINVTRELGMYWVLLSQIPS